MFDHDSQMEKTYTAVQIATNQLLLVESHLWINAIEIGFSLKFSVFVALHSFFYRVFA